MKRIQISTLILVIITNCLFTAAIIATCEFKKIYVDVGVDLPNVTLLVMYLTPIGWTFLGTFFVLVIALKDLWLRCDVCENINILIFLFLVLLTILVTIALFLPLMRIQVCLSRGG